jgi:hypothetical protein
MKPAKDETEFLGVIRPDSRSTSGLEESAQALVLETPDHNSKRNVIRNGSQ